MIDYCRTGRLRPPCAIDVGANDAQKVAWRDQKVFHLYAKRIRRTGIVPPKGFNAADRLPITQRVLKPSAALRRMNARYRAKYQIILQACMGKKKKAHKQKNVPHPVSWTLRKPHL